MYTIIKNANYEGCGLGKIVIISDAAESFAANYGYGSENLEAIQVLMNDLGYSISGSMWSRLHLLLLPVLSTTTEQAITNAINNNLTYDASFGTNVLPNIGITNRGLVVKKTIPELGLLQNAISTSNMAFSYHLTGAGLYGTLGEVASGHLGLSTGTYRSADFGLESIEVGSTKFNGLIYEPATTSTSNDGQLTAYSDTISVSPEAKGSAQRKLVKQLSNWILTAYQPSLNVNTDYPVYAMGHGDITNAEMPAFRSAIAKFVESILDNA